MKIEEILQLVDSVSKSALAEFKYEEGGVKLSLKKAGAAPQPVQMQEFAYTQPVIHTTMQTTGQMAAQADSDVDHTENTSPIAKSEDGKVVKSPLVGTFYTASSEDAEPFVNVGDSVKEGQVLAIVEAMKLMNDIESEFTGKITEILVQNGETVEYGQPLFVIK